MLLEELRTLLAVVDRRSFSRASDELRVARSTVRRRVKDLEERVGHELLERSTDGVTPTPAGEHLLQQARHLVTEADQLVANAASGSVEPEGRLVLAIPIGVPALLPTLLHRVLAQRYPQLTFDLRVLPEPAMALLHDADLAIQFGDPAQAGPWLRHDVGHARQRLLASPDYLAGHGRPESIDELRAHRLLLWCPPGEPGCHLTTAGGSRFVVDPYFISGDGHLTRVLASNGVGIGWTLDQPLPASDAERTNERLEVVLGGVVERQVPIACYLPSGRPRSPRARAAVDFVADLLAGLFNQA